MYNTTKYLTVKYAVISPIRIVDGRIVRPTRLDVLHDIAENKQGLYNDRDVKSAKREIMKTFSN